MSTRACSWRWCVLAGALAGLLAGPARAQDEIKVRTGAVYRGKVLSATAQGVKIEIAGRGTFDVPRDQIDSLTVTPPVPIVKGIQAYEKGSMKEAEATLKGVVFQFQGLDVDWASKGLLAYARACLANKNHAEAEKAFQSFVTWYPDHDLLRDASIGLAEVAIARKQYDAALSNLTVMVESFDRLLKPEGEKLRQAAQLNQNIALCHEGLNQPEEALNAYTKVIALYPAPEFYPGALYGAATLCARLGRFQRADLILTELVEGYKDFPSYREAVRDQAFVRQRLAAAASDKPAPAAAGAR